MPATDGSRVIGRNAAIAPAVERTLGKGEVACSNHAGSTIFLHLKYVKALLQKRFVLLNGAWVNNMGGA